MGGKHARFAASSSERWLNCSGSVLLIEQATKDYGEPEESSYAAEGTDAHAALEFKLKSWINRTESNFMTKAFKQKYAEWPEEMRKHVDWAVHEITRKETDTTELFAEQKVYLNHLTDGEKDMHGTLDAVVTEFMGELIIFDYKHGAGIAVDAEKNSQLIFYGLAMAHKFDYNFSRARIVVLQPRAWHPKGPIREDVLSMRELHKWNETFYQGRRKALRKGAPLQPGDWCHFCPAQIVCPAYSKRKFLEAQKEFSDL